MIKKKIEQNEKASLDLFNKIEAEKNQRLNIDEENIDVEYPNAPPEQNVDSQQKAHVTNRREQVIENNLNKSQDIILRNHPEVNNIHYTVDTRSSGKLNSSFDQHEENPIESPTIKNAHNRDIHPHPSHGSHGTNNSSSTLGSGPGSGSHAPPPHPHGGSQMEQAQAYSDPSKDKNNIMLKLVGISSDGKELKINIIFKSQNKDINFDYNLKTDTPEGICNEMAQAGLEITNSEAQKIQKDIHSIVNAAIEKIRMTATRANSGPTQENTMTKSVSDPTQFSGDSQHYTKSPLDTTQDTQNSDIQKNLEKANYAIHHFIKSVDQEIQIVAKYQAEIKQLSSTVETET